MTAAFKAANTYSLTFADFCEFYRENELTNIDAIKDEDHGTVHLLYLVDKFNISFHRYQINNKQA